MMTARQKRFAAMGLSLIAIGVAVFLVLNAFKRNLVFFFTPTQVAAGEAPKGRSFRIGGLVEAGTLSRESDGLTVHFVVTDTVHRIPVTYKGILPDLFKEGKGAVVQGRLAADGTFTAHEVLAKHDENYMPPEAAEALEKAKQSGARPTEARLKVPERTTP